MKIARTESGRVETTKTPIEFGVRDGIGQGLKPLESFDAWSSWFRKSETPVEVERPLKTVDLDVAERIPTLIEESPISSTGVGRNSRKLQRKVRMNSCTKPRNPQRSAGKIRTRRNRLPRMRNFDDWSNWFWRTGWPQVA